MNDLEIIIPAYNAHKTITKTLDSICEQISLPKYHVTIVNDHGKGYKEIIKRYKEYINLDETKTPKNKGPGAARQFGIDNTKSEFIIFIDSDDTFYDKDSVYKLYEKIHRTKADLVISSFVYNKYKVTEIKEKETTWLHGKIYKREFLINNNIRFNDSRTNEDNGFNSLIMLLRPVTVLLNEPTYNYNDNPSSLTRNNVDEYTLNGLKDYAFNINWAVEEGLARKALEKDIAHKIMEGLTTMYKYYNNSFNRTGFDEIIKWSKELYEKYLLYKDMADEYEEKILNENPPLSKHISFIEFKEKIKKSK